MCVCWGQETVASDGTASLFSSEATAISGQCMIALLPHDSVSLVNRIIQENGTQESSH